MRLHAGLLVDDNALVGRRGWKFLMVAEFGLLGRKLKRAREANNYNGEG